MKKIPLILVLFSVLSSCGNDDTNSVQDFLIFGHFYAACSGEYCVETFKLTGEKLFEDTISEYYAFGNSSSDDFFDFSVLNFNFMEIGNDKFEQTQDLFDWLPTELLNSNTTVFGCPDCVDEGGILIQYQNNGVLKSYLIDQNKDRVPNELHSFIDKVNEKIDILNN